jgi:hypothetical protein
MGFKAGPVAGKEMESYLCQELNCDCPAHSIAMPAELCVCLNVVVMSCTAFIFNIIIANVLC